MSALGGLHLLRHMQRAYHRPFTKLNPISPCTLRHSTSFQAPFAIPAPYERRISRLVIPKAEGSVDVRFPPSPSFQTLRQDSLSFFDKTRYIPLLSSDESARVKLFCRPDNFGKSFTKSMLATFHGVEYKQLYGTLFGGLDVGAAVKRGEIESGRYLVLDFDFEQGGMGGESTAMKFGGYLNQQLREFVERYRGCGLKLELDGCDFGSHDKVTENLRVVVRQVCRELEEIKSTKDEGNVFYNVRGIFVMIDNLDASARDVLLTKSTEHWVAAAADLSSAYISFFQAIKSGMDSHSNGISQLYMTGTAPLLLSRDVLSPFDSKSIANLSFDYRFCGLCGLTTGDISHALDIICVESSRKKHLINGLRNSTSSYHFSAVVKVLKTFNTLTTTEYLTSIPRNPEADSETTIYDASSPLLSRLLSHLCTSNRAFAKDLEQALSLWKKKKRMRYNTEHLPSYITPADLLSSNEKDRHSWRMLLLYHGILRFDSQYPGKFLALMNGERLGREVLKKPATRVSNGKMGRVHEAVGEEDRQP